MITISCNTTKLPCCDMRLSELICFECLIFIEQLSIDLLLNIIFYSFGQRFGQQHFECLPSQGNLVPGQTRDLLFPHPGPIPGHDYRPQMR